MLLQVSMCTTERLAHLHAPVRQINGTGVSHHALVTACLASESMKYTASVAAVKTFSVRQMWLSLYQNMPQNHILLDETLHRNTLFTPRLFSSSPFVSLVPQRLPVQRQGLTLPRGRLSFLSTVVLAEDEV